MNAQKLFESGVIGFDELIHGVSETTVNAYRSGYDDGYNDGAADSEIHLDSKCDELDALYRENQDNLALIRRQWITLADIREIAAKLQAAAEHPEDRSAFVLELIGELREAAK